MKRGLIVFLLFLLFALFIIADVYVELEYPILAVENLESGKLPKGSSLRILQITDLHDKHFGEDESRLLALAGKAKPDVIAITGDLADHTTRNFSNIFTLVSNLKVLTPDIYYVPGNHEQSDPVMNKLFEGLSRLGVNVLMDKGSVYVKGGVKANICGINFPFKETSRSYGPQVEKALLSEALKGVDPAKYTILLSHSPKIVNSIGASPVDLILSGHTHGGQVRLPLIGLILKPDEEMFGRYDKGLFSFDSGLKLYVDSGLGTSIIPVRFCDRAEISLLTINGR